MTNCGDSWKSQPRAVRAGILWPKVNLFRFSSHWTSVLILRTGKIEVGPEEYEINEAFQQGALQVADILDLDEVEAARLFVDVQLQSSVPTQSSTFRAVTAFHERRDALLQSLRLILQASQEFDNDDGRQLQMQDIVSRILETKDRPRPDGSVFTGKCIRAMHETESWQIKVLEQIQKASLLGLSQCPELPAILEFQRVSLSKQHEALGACLCLLFKAGYTRVHDLHSMLEALQRFDRIEISTIHYLPGIAAGFAHYGSLDGCGSLSEAKSLHTTIMEKNLKPLSVSLQPLQAVLCLIWISEYSSCYRESIISTTHRELDKDSQARLELANNALNDGALTLLLFFCSYMTDDQRHHPARHELATLLLGDTNYPAIDGDPPAPFFRLLFMEFLETLAESWITNMPDSIRQLKNEEDDQRLQHITAMQEGVDGNIQRGLDVRLHLECFLVLISFAFEQRPDAAEVFWADPDGNLFGFLQWASKRQTVPRVSAFCEMLTAISVGRYADNGHRFLLEDLAGSSLRFKRSSCMSYAQIFAELELYAVKVNEKPSAAQDVPGLRKGQPTDMNELESPVMLACYLRLIAHICRNSSIAREYIWEHSNFNLVRTTLSLSSGPVPNYLRASVFASLESLLVSRSNVQSYWMWSCLDEWAAHGISPTPSKLKPTHHTGPSLQDLQQTLDAISTSFDQYSTFVALLRTLSLPLAEHDLQHILPFPSDLGAAYRDAGIKPYVDFICGTLFAKRLNELPDEPPSRTFRFQCLDVMAIALEGFDESLVAVAAQSRISGPAATMLADYVSKHPFSIVMEWLLRDDVVRGLLHALRLPFEEVEQAAPDAIDIMILSRSLDLFTAMFDLQPTYQELVRPLIRKQSHSATLATNAGASVEEIIAGHLDIVPNLTHYVGTCHNHIVLGSLTLLHKLSRSSKLNPAKLTVDRKLSNRRLIDMLGPQADLDIVSFAVSSRMGTDVRELEAGPDAASYQIKDGVLTFLINCLSDDNKLPGIAHIILGFRRIRESLVVQADGGVERQGSLLAAVIGLAEEYPDGEDNIFSSWLMHIKTSALHVLRQLWTSPLTSGLILVILRKLQFLASQFAKQVSLSSDTQWDGRLLADPMFWVGSSAGALVEFLGYRSFLCEYAATEMRAAIHMKSATLRSRTLSTLRGSSTDSSIGPAIAHVSILDMFDIADLEIREDFALPELTTLPMPDLSSCIRSTYGDSRPIYDTEAVEEMLQFSLDQLLRDENPPTSHIQDIATSEVDALLSFFKASNQLALVRMARKQALRMWADLVSLTVQHWPADQDTQIQFVLDVVKLINPKIDLYLQDEMSDALELLDLADTLTDFLSNLTAASLHGQTSRVMVSRQLQLFQTCIGCIASPSSTADLRGGFYGICIRVLSQVERLPEANAEGRRQCFACIKAAGIGLINVLSDDAENGQDGSRLPAFILLTLLASVARQEKSGMILAGLVQLNMFEVLLDPVRDIPNELRASDSQGS